MISRLPRRNQSGFTLVEVLVTLLIVSVGLLGVAALQLTTLRGNQEAYVRSQASVLAADILDRIRANPLAFRVGAYTVALNGTGTAGSAAGKDLAAWQADIDRRLPGGAAVSGGSIAMTQTATSTGDRFIVTITIQWAERESEATDTDADRNPETLTFMTRSEI